MVLRLTILRNVIEFYETRRFLRNKTASKSINNMEGGVFHLEGGVFQLEKGVFHLQRNFVHSERGVFHSEGGVFDLKRDPKLRQ